MGTDISGIDEGYEDALGVWRETPAATRSALLSAMGVDPAQSGPPAEAPVRVVRTGQALPPDLPFGYHELCPLDGGVTVRIIVSPGRCYLPAGWHTWGWAVQLYALRSAESWGIGDLADLRHLGR